MIMSANSDQLPTPLIVDFHEDISSTAVNGGKDHLQRNSFSDPIPDRGTANATDIPRLLGGGFKIVFGVSAAFSHASRDTLIRRGSAGWFGSSVIQPARFAFTRAALGAPRPNRAAISLYVASTKSGVSSSMKRSLSGRAFQRIPSRRNTSCASGLSFWQAWP